MIRTPDNTNWKTIQFAERESPVATGERLIVNLLAGDCISASVPGVYDHVSIVGIVFVAARQND